MNTYHISYAAFDMENDEPGNDYIRARRYLPLVRKGLKGTELAPDFFRTGFFRTGDTHKITVVKQDRDLYMHIENANQKALYHWHVASLPPVREGRIGLRHIVSRAARYNDFRVSVLKPIDINRVTGQQ